MSAEILRRAAEAMRSDAMPSGEFFDAVADWLDETAEFFNPNSAIWETASTVARTYLGEQA